MASAQRPSSLYAKLSAVKETLDFVVRHGYLILFLSVLVEQMGVPLPSIPMLLAIGALAGNGQFSYPAALAFAVLACLIADCFWYWLGVYKGSSILRLLCKISLEPDSCVRRTENMFVRYGAPGMLFAKFVPGLSTAAAPLAGMFRMKIWKFLLADGVGALIWAGCYSALGFIFRNQLERLAQIAGRAGSSLFVFLTIALGGYFAWKYIERRRFYGELRVARIAPEELHAMLASGEPVTLVDLRNALEWEEDNASKIPGALHMAYEDLEARMPEIPLDRDVILYCT
ncbi:MAG: VTT domain-containing protein [Acidobacteriota bacterium]|nr:VTT domain-containing protein [Acidobacteriota bacterium]